MNKDQQAFPCPVAISHTGVEYVAYPGMALRDYFAAKALPAVIVQCANDTRRPNESPHEYFARIAYELADAMLCAREVQP